jgi:hypothetical protein
MTTHTRVATVAALAVLAVAAPGTGVSAAPVVHDHANFTSDPYPDSICGVPTTNVDRVVETYRESADGSSMDNVMLTTTFTAASGKSITFKSAGVAKRTAPVANGDGTFTFTATVYGLSPKIQVVGGTPIAVDTGNITFSITDDANGEFVSFDVLSIKGPRPAGGCDAIVAALT